MSILPTAVALLAQIDYPAPERVRVLPVFFVPKDQAAPTKEQLATYLKHLRWSRDRYREILGTTFELAQENADVYMAAYPLLAYRPLPEDASPRMIAELLRHYGTDRFTCPHVLATILMNPCENHPAGGGRPLNGGHDLGGGFLVISSWALEFSPNFQSTLQHELGHSFGLVHADAYGFPMDSGDTMMSYNPKHHSMGFEPSATPGTLIPEDRRALAKNHRVFPGLRYEVPKDYPIRDGRMLPPMRISDEAPWIEDPKKRSGDGTGYELFEGGSRGMHEPTWNRVRAVRDLASRKGEGRHNGITIHAGGGYELFVDGKRAGHEPGWTLDQGVANLRWNRQEKPGHAIEARFDGLTVLLWEPAGYELFFDGRRVGYEPKFSRNQALDNLAWNRKRQTTGKNVEGRFGGERLP